MELELTRFRWHRRLYRSGTRRALTLSAVW